MITTYYYQSFVGLHKLLTHIQDIDVINISSIHFDEGKGGGKDIYLNDNLRNMFLRPCLRYIFFLYLY